MHDCTIAEERQSQAGAFFAIGLCLVASGSVSVMSGAAWQPTIDKQTKLVDDMEEDGQPAIRLAPEQEYLQNLESKQQSLKTLGYVLIGAGGASFIIAMIEGQRTRSQKLTVIPAIGNKQASLNIGLRF